MLLLKDKGIVKSKKFKNHKYIGDPINAVKIFNDLKTDELIFLDILATAEKRTVLIDFIKDIGKIYSKSNMDKSSIFILQPSLYCSELSLCIFFPTDLNTV